LLAPTKLESRAEKWDFRNGKQNRSSATSQNVASTKYTGRIAIRHLDGKEEGFSKGGFRVLNRPNACEENDRNPPVKGVAFGILRLGSIRDKGKGDAKKKTMARDIALLGHVAEVTYNLYNRRPESSLVEGEEKRCS